MFLSTSIKIVLIDAEIYGLLLLCEESWDNEKILKAARKRIDHLTKLKLKIWQKE